mmetsp:Transcript_162940/g.522479  ORF Transcript_162940/g.522479 Transcript_162940/m.522479 type:complete len:208 (+) Transcript_162940:1245-1868(+)
MHGYPGLCRVCHRCGVDRWHGDTIACSREGWEHAREACRFVRSRPDVSRFGRRVPNTVAFKDDTCDGPGLWRPGGPGRRQGDLQSGGRHRRARRSHLGRARHAHFAGIPGATDDEFPQRSAGHSHGGPGRASRGPRRQLRGLLRPAHELAPRICVQSGRLAPLRNQAEGEGLRVHLAARLLRWQGALRPGGATDDVGDAGGRGDVGR